MRLTQGSPQDLRKLLHLETGSHKRGWRRNEAVKVTLIQCPYKKGARHSQGKKNHVRTHRGDGHLRPRGEDTQRRQPPATPGKRLLPAP